MARRESVSESLERRRSAVLRHMTAIEAPRVLYLVVGIIVVFDLGYAATGLIMPFNYYLSDVGQSAVHAGVALALQRKLIPDRWAPTAFMTAVVANNAAVTYQAMVIHDLGGLVAAQGALGIIALLLGVSGAVALAWRPFLIGAAACTSITSLSLYNTMPDIWLTWLITMVTAVLVAAVIMYSRYESALDLARAQEAVETLAVVDPLTQLLNRRGLEENASVVLGRARRAGDSFFVVFIDVSGLKRVNDEHGHAIGDRLLQRVSHALHDYCRSSELLCRWGGDEFVLLGVGARPDPDVLHERLQLGIDMTDLEEYWTPNLWIGAADGTPNTHNLEHVIMLADHDMYARRAAATPA